MVAGERIGTFVFSFCHVWTLLDPPSGNLDERHESDSIGGRNIGTHLDRVVLITLLLGNE